jgi:hypothetical protein
MRRGRAERRESQEKSRMEQLSELHEAGALNDEEFAKQRAQLPNG